MPRKTPLNKRAAMAELDAKLERDRIARAMRDAPALAREAQAQALLQERKERIASAAMARKRNVSSHGAFDGALYERNKAPAYLYDEGMI